MGSIPPALLSGAGAVLVGVVMHVVGVATTHWMQYPFYVRGLDCHKSFGLFRTCAQCPGATACEDIADKPKELKATIALVILGLLCGLMCLALVGLFVLFKYQSKPIMLMMRLASLAGCYAACGLIFMGVIVYAVKLYKDFHDFDSSVDLGYSFGLCIAGAVLMAAGGTLAFLGSRVTSGTYHVLR